jgi:chromate reductase, NAD(P)H dehydrogenase (quinone)
MGIAGSLRRGSYNRALLNAAIALAPASLTIVPFPIDSIPLYNADVDTDELRPLEVTKLKQAIAGADGVLLVSPEYNHGVPGVMQNAIDWASRPGYKSILVGKPVAIAGASAGVVGTARMQQQLKLAMMSTLALVMPHPGVLVGQAADKFDASGALTHEPTRQFLATFLGDFERWLERLK